MMEKVEYDLDTSGGLMEEIQALVAPPQTEDTKKKQLSNKEQPLPKRPIRAVNRDSCDACNEGGDLLCCDQCPSSFHLQCCDPPLEDEDVPTGEWICNECKYGVKKKSDLKLFRLSSRNDQANVLSSPADSNLGIHVFEKLTEMFRHKNPTEFQLPPDIQDFTVMPGDRKRHVNKESKDQGQPKKKDDDGQRLCFVCTKSQRVGELVNCDFCPLVFHRDCLMPPLGQDPLGLWMCPNHPENFEPRLRHPKYSQRSQIIEELRSNVNHNAVKLSFFRRAKKERILMNRRFHQPDRRRTCVVPDIVKSQYKNPPAVVIPDYLDNINKNLQPHMRPFTLPTSQEKEQWLRAVIDLQCSIAGSLERKTSPDTPAKENIISSEENTTETTSSDTLSSPIIDPTLPITSAENIKKPVETDSSQGMPRSPLIDQISPEGSTKEECKSAKEECKVVKKSDSEGIQKHDISIEEEPSLECHENSGDFITTGFQMDHDGLCMKPPPEVFPLNSTPKEKRKASTDAGQQQESQKQVQEVKQVKEQEKQIQHQQRNQQDLQLKAQQQQQQQQQMQLQQQRQQRHIQQQQQSVQQQLPQLQQIQLQKHQKQPHQHQLIQAQYLHQEHRQHHHQQHNKQMQQGQHEEDKVNKQQQEQHDQPRSLELQESQKPQEQPEGGEPQERLLNLQQKLLPLQKHPPQQQQLQQQQQWQQQQQLQRQQLQLQLLLQQKQEQRQQQKQQQQQQQEKPQEQQQQEQTETEHLQQQKQQQQQKQKQLQQLHKQQLQLRQHLQYENQQKQQQQQKEREKLYSEKDPEQGEQQLPKLQLPLKRQQIIQQQQPLPHQQLQEQLEPEEQESQCEDEDHEEETNQQSIGIPRTSDGTRKFVLSKQNGSSHASTSAGTSPAISPVGSSVASSKAPVSSPGSHMVSSISTEILKDPTLCQLDERLVRILAFQRLQQLIEKKSQQIPKISKPGITEKKVISQVTENRPGIAVLSPLNGVGAGCYMRHKTFNAGQGADMDLCISNYGFCNYVSGKHATIFYDQETRQFELLNYSEHGTIVDNVLYSCDFSEKTKSNITSSNAKFDGNSKFHNSKQRLKKPPIGRTTRGLGTEYITQACNCRASASSLIGGSGAGWEGTAVLHHGSYVKFGCLHFIFSIVACATNVGATPKTNYDVSRPIPNNTKFVQLPVKGEPASAVT